MKKTLLLTALIFTPLKKFSARLISSVFTNPSYKVICLTSIIFMGLISFIAKSQNDTMYIYKNGAVIYEKVVADIDSIIFYDAVNTVPTGVTASASPNPICAGSTLTLTGDATGATSWSWTGPNSFSSSSQSPTIASITTAGAGVYTLTAGNSYGWSAGANTASVTVNEPPTTATNGSTQTICTTGNATLSGNDPSVGTGAWTVTSGPSTSSSQFANTSVYNTTFTPAGGAGNYVVRWTISNSPCTDSYADATITVNAPPTTADAGADINPPCDATTATLAGNDPTVGSGTWSVVSGTATITTPGAYNSGVTGLAVSGVATLRWTISNPPCTDSYDEVVITTSACFTCGTSTVDDIDGNTYNTVLIGSQCWLKENMRTTKYPDNFAITKGPSAHGAAGWDTDNAYYSCPPNTSNNGDDCAAAASLGMLYQWSAAMNGSTTEGAQGICPAGWHIPTDAEWKTLEGELGMSVADQDATDWRGTNEGSKMANHVADQDWTAGNLTGDSEFNTSDLVVGPSGYRYTDGSYYYRSNSTFLWSSTESGTFAWTRYLRYAYTQVNRTTNNKAYGFSVRCLKD